MGLLILILNIDIKWDDVFYNAKDVAPKYSMGIIIIKKVIKGHLGDLIG